MARSLSDKMVTYVNRCSNRSRLLPILFSLLFSFGADAGWYTDTRPIMGTDVHVEFWYQPQSASDRKAEELIDAVMAEMQRIESVMSPYIESSELYRINKLAASKSVPLSDEMFFIISKAQYFSKISDGAFDISFASVGRFYTYRDKLKPSDAEINALLPAIDYRHIELDPEKQQISFAHPHLKIDLGGIAKGYAVDRGIEILHSAAVQSAIVSAGGDSRILGNRRGQAWTIGIRHPRQADDYAVKIPLEDTAISTSGDYERFFITEQGQRVHHIINPRSGKSEGQLQSVSVLAEHAVDSDALSTTLFVLGVKNALALANQLPGIDTIIIDQAGDLHYSDGLLMPVNKQ